MQRLNEHEKQRLIRLVQDLVGINSAIITPEQANRERTEERMAEFLTQYLRNMGMTVQRQEVFPGRPNLMAHWPGQGDKRSIMLEAHMDTVTVEGMTIDPFAAQVRDGKIWGRGTCDTKGNMAAFLTALDIAYRRNQLPADKLYFVATMSEETCCTGSAALMDHGFRTDAAIVGEATRCRLVTAHKAPLWLEIETNGRSCHASMPDHGINAIEMMARVIEFVQGPWNHHLQVREHPLLGKSTMQVTTVEGGSKINIIPSRCRIQVDGRIVPGRPIDEIVTEFHAMLAEHLRGMPFQILSQQSHPALDTPLDAPLVQKLMPLCREAAGQTAPLGVNYFADTGPFAQAGITSVLFGAGDIAQAHTAEEFLELDQLFLAAEIMLTLLTENAGMSIVEAT